VGCGSLKQSPVFKQERKQTMKKQSTRTGFVVMLCTILLAGILGLSLHFAHRTERIEASRYRSVQAAQPVDDTSAAPQVVVGTPEFDGEPVRDRYSYRNERNDPNRIRSLHLIDTERNQEQRLGDDHHAAIFGAINNEYLLWFWGRDLHTYTLATGADTVLATLDGRLSFPQISGDWVAFGEYNGDGSKLATLYAGNIQTHEMITLTERLWAPNARVHGYFGIGASLAAWYDPPDGIIVYDLHSQREITRITHLFSAFNDSLGEIYAVSAGETVVTWNRGYGYDLVTQSYFSLDRTMPLDDTEPYATMSRVQEVDRVLSWSFTYADGTRRYVRAPLLDATPSAAPCVEGQNLVQNGDLEDIAAHNVWQQSDTASDLIVNELPPNAPQGGQWAIRLGRYSNAQPAVQQTLAIPSNVKGITLAFDGRVNSWDIWGGDQLQVDLIDPVTNQSILVTPVQWTNVQLASGDWMPMQVEIQDWPGIDTPFQLVFRAQTDWAFPTDFTVDNIRFITTCQ